MKSNEVFAQEMAEIIRAYKATSSVRGGELEVYTTGDVASFYRAAGSHGMLVMVNTANESVQVKVPMEHAGKTMTDVIAGVDVELPTVMTMEPYQYFIYPHSTSAKYHINEKIINRLYFHIPICKLHFNS